MRLRGLVFCAAWLCVLTCAVSARDFEVKLLKGRPDAGYWGTSEFSAYVNYYGVVRHVKVRGKEILWQATALYTAPVQPGQKRGARTVQGEGHGKRGLTVVKPKFTTRDEKGKRIFEFEHLIANKKVLGGKPLCKANQKIVITPTGEINVTYDFEWLHTLRWGNFGQLVIFDEKNSAGRSFLILTDQRPYTGVLNPGPVTKNRVRHKTFEQLTIQPEVGPVHFVWREKANCSFHWPKRPQLQFKPQAVPYRGSMYKGTKGRLDYSILLPVSLQ